MLIFVGMSTEATECGSRHMLIFHSAQLPGMHYKVETDAGTVSRLREIVGSEVVAIRAAIEDAEDGDDCHGPNNHRF